MSKGSAILGATTRACANPACTQTFTPRSKRHRCCSDPCRKIVHKNSAAFKARQYKRSVRQHEKRVQHQRRRRTFTAAVADYQGGVPTTPPKQFPEDAFSPEAIQRFENAKRLKEKQ